MGVQSWEGMLTSLSGTGENNWGGEVVGCEEEGEWQEFRMDGLTFMFEKVKKF